MADSLHRRHGENCAGGRPVTARLLAAAFLIGVPTAGSAQDPPLARWVDRPTALPVDCGGVSLTAGNAVGLLAERDPGGIVRVAVLYRVGRATDRLALHLPAEDAARLSDAVAALLRGERTRPIRFERASAPGGGCGVRRVIG